MLHSATKALRIGCVAAIIFGVVSAIYLTDRSSSDLETIEWLPRYLHGVARWADYHGRFRNVPAYAVLALPALILLRRPGARGRAVLILAVFATVMEYTQLFIPTRYFEWQDIAESWLGLVAAWFLVETGRGTINRLRRHGRKRCNISGLRESRAFLRHHSKPVLNVPPGNKG
jgi:hypothetical protein